MQKLWYVSPRRASGWARRNIAIGDVIVIVAALIAYLVLSGLDTFEWFHRATRAYEDLQLDEVATGFVVAAVALGVLLFMRSRRLTREVRRRIRAEAEASALARHDPLTGIANRRLFNEFLDRWVNTRRDNDAHGAVLVLDLNRFKAINDVYGHAAGDRLLIAVTERLRPLVRSEDSFARLGGDEFGIALMGVNREDVVRLVNRVLAAMEQPFDLGGFGAEVGVSLGIALFPSDAADAEAIIRHADMAMYRAKATGMSGHAFFDAALDESLRDRAALEADLRHAVGTDEIVPFYQPLVRLADGQTSGFEMLARWNHPTRGLIMPEVFIPIAEDSRLIGALSLGLLRRALSDARTWDSRLILSINLSAEQFRDDDLATRILSTLAVAEFDPHRLEVEMTETALVVDMATAKATIEKLKLAGVRIAIDDFGKGYSSLYYLRELPFDVVKIDQSFISTRRSNPESAKIVAAVIGLSQAMGMATVAEGIEEKIDADWLREQGCVSGQGFLYSQAVPASEVPILLAAKRAA